MKEIEIYNLPPSEEPVTQQDVRNIVTSMRKFGTGTNILIDGYQRSQNFVPNTSGWQWTPDSVEINTGTFKLGGTLITVNDLSVLQSSIDSLVALGGGTIALVPDTYTATTSFTIPSGVTIDGNGATIDFGAGAFQFLAEGTNAYSTGTLAVNFNSATVTGTGTTWTAAMVGRSILIGDFWYEITARASDTSITISPAFQAPNVSGVTYVIATTIDDIGLINITLTNSSITAFKFRYVNGLVMDGLATTLSGQGIDGDDSATIDWLNSYIDDCTVGATYDNVVFPNFDSFSITNITGGTGLALTGMSNAALGVFSIQDVVGVGLKFTNCFNLGADNYSIIECTSHAIECVSGNSAIDLDSGYIDTVGGDGIKLTATSDGITIDAQTIKNYTGYGINIAASTCDNNKIGLITYGGGGSGTLNDSGTGTIVIGTTFKSGTTTKDAADASATQNIAHGLGVIPDYVRITANGPAGSVTQSSDRAYTVYNGTTQSSVSTVGAPNVFTTSTEFVLNNTNTANNTQKGVVTFDATNIIITWTKANSPTGIYTLLWEAEG